MKKENYQSELNNLYIELEKVENMSELEACEFCGTDSKEEGLEAIQEEIDYYESMLRESESEESDYTLGLDPAFSSWYQVNSMFV